MLSSSFTVNVGAKEVCVLTPVMFDMFLATIAFVLHTGFDKTVALVVRGCFYGSMFNL